MCAGMLWPHIDGHRIVTLPIFTRLAILDGVNIFYVLLLHKAALKLPFLRPRFLILTDMAATLVEFSPAWRAQRLVSNAGIGIIRHLATPVWLRQIKARQRTILASWVCSPIHRHEKPA